jgi:chaperonin GroES
MPASGANDAKTKRTGRSTKASTKAVKARTKRGAAAPELRLTGDRLVVRTPDDGERRTSGGLLIPATAAPAPRRLTWGDVTLVGPDVRVAKEGDRVLFLPSAGLEVELDGDDLVLLRERDIQAVSTHPAPGTTDRPGQYL